MERPRRSVRPPGTLTDFLTAGETEKRSAAGAAGGNRDVEEGKQEQQQPDNNKEKDGAKQEGHGLGNTDDKLLLSQPYKCRECKARYRSRVALLRHAGKHSGEKPFMCSECGKGLSSQSALSEHVNIHTNNRPHRCEECGLESRQLSVHLRHLLTHQTRPDRLYTCSICTRTFKQNEYLRRHMRKHTGEKPYTCGECGKSFTCKSELNRHGKRHSSERPHPCPECGQGFKMRHNLQAHLRAHAGTQQWRCILCPAVFPKLKLLESHRRTHQETVQHLHISRPHHTTLLVCAAGGDRRRLPTVHPISLPASANTLPSSTLENHTPASEDPNFEEDGIQVNHTEEDSTNLPSKSTPLSATHAEDSPVSSVSHSPNLPTGIALTPSFTKDKKQKLLRINDTTLPLDLVLKSVGKGGAIRVKIIDHPPPQPCPESTSGNGSGGGVGCRGDGDSVVELVDAEDSNGKSDGLKYGIGGEAGEAVATTVKGNVSGKGSMVEAAGVLGARASVLSHCLAPHFTRPDPHRHDYRTWLATLTTFCNQLDPPLDPEVCRCLSTTVSTLQKCLILSPSTGTLHGTGGEVTSMTEEATASVRESPPPCQDLHQYKVIHKHYLNLLEVLHKHFTHLTTSVIPPS
ncbi:hypothetical protein Pmani_035035 [Petrolisthes manimaculis]|uniref:C2H2-type domain-containing protein n=1 Tax=Petrolisthes manimaculis TaxID=1843537 RepID=A0AAE1NLF4_9EUCA|nr:hypothetical protein Pmani_035035 [Petrolisthes manimaculis]